MFLVDQKSQKTKIDSQRILTTRYCLPSYAVKLIFGGLLSHIDDCWHKYMYLICWEMVGVRFTRGVRLRRLPPTWFPLVIKCFQTVKKRVRKFSKANKRKFNRILSLIDWSHLNEFDNLDFACAVGLLHEVL